MAPLRKALACVLTLGFLATGMAASQERDSLALSKQIDNAIHARLKKDGIPAAPRASDARLLRRLYLDLVGRLPTVAEAEAFLTDPAPDKVHTLIDQLLSHPEMPVYWRRVIDRWLNGPLDRQARQVGHDEFLAWLERSLGEHKPWDRLARELLLPDAASPQQRGATFFLTSRLRAGDKAEQLDNLATSVSSGLFGVQLQCAKCHDHPFVDEWKQDHYYGLAAFFNRLEAKNEGGRSVLAERAAGEVKFVTRKKGEKTAPAMFLDSVVLDEAAPTLAKGNAAPSGTGSRRQKLIEHALRAESPYFKRSLVNRVWKQLLGRGLVEPVDQIHQANPASHPALLDALGDDFADHGFSLRRLMAGILHSETYLRDSQLATPKRPADELYAAAILKPLSGEQMAWSLAVATGYSDQLAARYAKDLKPAPAKGQLTPALRIRWEKELEFDAVVEKYRYAGESFQANATQALFATFNPFTQKLLQPAPGNLVQRLAAEKDNGQLARGAFLAILSRLPSAEEVTEVTKHLESAGNRTQVSADLVWALLSSAEFRFNH
ncbi:MAG: DUF1549 domain-containing protein [Planctomycetia bacterium]|nr:DUF1549 domain-containing protein [Planctomycetia bacterium]